MKDNQTGHIKETVIDTYRQFIVNCLGDNDRRKYFSLAPFGIDFNIPENTRSLTVDSRNKDQKFNIGVLNRVYLDDLDVGEVAIFSTDSTGEELKSKTVHRNNGDIEINKGLTNGNILIKADGTIEFNGSADNMVGFLKLKEGFDQLVSDVNDIKDVVNGIRSDQNTFATAYVPGSPSTLGTPPTYAITSSPANSSSANIDNSKKDNLKIE